jgi:hypothetical protein
VVVTLSSLSRQELGQVGLCLRANACHHQCDGAAVLVDVMVSWTRVNVRYLTADNVRVAHYDPASGARNAAGASANRGVRPCPGWRAFFSNTVHSLGPWEPSDRAPVAWIQQRRDRTPSRLLMGDGHGPQGGGLRPTAMALLEDTGIPRRRRFLNSSLLWWGGAMERRAAAAGGTRAGVCPRPRTRIRACTTRR